MAEIGEDITDTLDSGIQDGELGHKRKMEITQLLLKNFNMEETKQKYSCQSQVDFTIDPASFSVDSSFEATIVRERLIHLMGTDTIRMNDRKFMEKLQDKVREEYDDKEDKKEKQLMEDERKRIRRLINDGIIQPSDIEEALRLGHGRETKPSSQKKNKKESQYHCHNDSIMECNHLCTCEQNRNKLVDEKQKPKEVTHRPQKNEDDSEDKEKAEEEESGEKDIEENTDENEKHHPDPVIDKFRHESTIPALYLTGHDVVMSTINRDGVSHDAQQNEPVPQEATEGEEPASEEPEA